MHAISVCVARGLQVMLVQIVVNTTQQIIACPARTYTDIANCNDHVEQAIHFETFQIYHNP